MAVNSDDFEDGSIGAEWTFVDPTGNSTVSESGGELTITVASGAVYELGPNNQDAPRLIQELPSSDVDFDISVHITSTPDTHNHGSGLCLIGEDAALEDHYITVLYNARFGGLTNWLVENTDNSDRDWSLDFQELDPPPEWLRMTRTTSGGTETYTFYSSTDGENWTQQYTNTYSETVTWSHLGIVAVSGGDTPGYTATFGEFVDADDTGGAEEESPPQYSAQCDWIRVNSQGVTTIFKPPF